MKVGIFYFQYTLLKQLLFGQESEILYAPRGHGQEEEKSLGGENKESAREAQFKELEKHNQPQKALGLSSDKSDKGSRRENLLIA